MTRAREETGAKRIKIDITDREWDAIQKGAVGHTTLSAIIKYSDPDDIKQRAMPRTKSGVSSNQRNLAKLMAGNGYTQAQIADRLGVSASTVSDIIKGKE